MTLRDLPMRIRRSLRSLQRLPDDRKRRVVIGGTAACMLLVLAVWFGSLGSLVPALAGVDGSDASGAAAPHTSALGTLSNGFRVLGGEASARWQALRGQAASLFSSIEERMSNGSAYVVTPPPAGGPSSAASSSASSTESPLLP